MSLLSSDHGQADRDGRLQGTLPGGARLWKLSQHRDERGSLFAMDFLDDLPFAPRRIFAVVDVPAALVRGEHAHRRCHQFLIALAGSVTVLVDDGRSRTEVLLDDPGVGLHVPPMNWGAQFGHAPGTVLGVLASEHYAEADYIRDYDEFLRLRQAADGSQES